MPDSASRPLRVFLCHSSGDKPAVRELYQKLNSEGWIDAWLDEEKLLPGQNWNDEIEKALEITDAVIVTLSTGSVSKEGYVQKELKFVLDIALEKPEDTIFILPLRLDDCDRPRRLRSIHGVDYYPPENRERAYERILKSLELRAKALGIDVEKRESTTSKGTHTKDQKNAIGNASIGQARIKIIVNPWSDPTILAGQTGWHTPYQSLATLNLDGKKLSFDDDFITKNTKRPIEIFNQLVDVGQHEIFLKENYSWEGISEKFSVSDGQTAIATIFLSREKGHSPYTVLKEVTSFKDIISWKISIIIGPGLIG